MSYASPPFDVLVASDFSATSGPDTVALAPGERIEAVFTALAPSVRCAPAPALSFAPRCLADFEPRALQRALAACGSWPSEARAGRDVLQAILRDPAFIAAEAAWRGLARLIEALDVSAPHAAALRIVSAPRRELVATVVARGLAPLEDDPRRALGLVLLDTVFGGDRAEVAELTALVRWCAALQAPLVTQVGPRVFGVSQAVHVPSLADLPQRLVSLPSKDLEALRRDEAVRWATLVFGRWLARSRHVEPTLDFSEELVPERPETLPFANGCWLAATGLVRSVQRHGHALESVGFTTGATHRGLGVVRPPGRKARPGEQPPPSVCTDVQLDDATATALLRAGFTPLVERSPEGVAAFAMLANFFRPNGPRLTAAGSTAHQLYQGASARIALTTAASSSESEYPARVRAELTAWVAAQTPSPVSDTASTAPQEGAPSAVEVLPQADGFEIHLAPPVALDGKPVQVELWIPSAEVRHDT